MNKLKKIVGLSLVTSTLLFCGCGSTDDTVEEKMTAQEALDNQNYAKAIELLEPKADKQSGDYMILSSAYAGKAGYSISDILILVSDSSESEDDSFKALLKEVEKKSLTDDTVYSNLDNAIKNLEFIKDKNNQVYFNLGLVNIIQSTSSLALLSDMNGFDDDDSFAKDDLLATACALDYMDDKVLSNPICVSLIPKPIKINGKDYTLLSITINGSSYNDFYKLADSQKENLILTKGECSFLQHENENCIEDDSQTYFVPTPVLDGNVTVIESLINTINDGFDNIEETTSEEIKEDVLDYKSQLDKNDDGKVSQSEFAQYIYEETK